MPKLTLYKLKRNSLYFEDKAAFMSVALGKINKKLVTAQFLLVIFI